MVARDVLKFSNCTRIPLVHFEELFQNITRAYKLRNALALIRFSILVSIRFYRRFEFSEEDQVVHAGEAQGELCGGSGSARR